MSIIMKRRHMVSAESSRLSITYLLTERMSVFGVPEYGVSVVNEASGERSDIPGLTVDRAQAERFLGLLVRGQVTPCSLPELAADFLAAEEG